MKVNLSISKRLNAEGYSEIMLLVRRRFDGKVIDIRAKSGIFIDPKMFDSKKKTVKMFSANKLQTNDVKFHNAQLKKLDALICKINEAYNNEADKNNIFGKWLENVVHSNSDDAESTPKDKTVHQLFNDYLCRKTLSVSTVNSSKVVINCIARFEQFVRETNKRKQNFTFDVNTVTSKDIEDLKYFYTHEKELSGFNPNLFKKIFKSLQITQITHNRDKINRRGNNSVNKFLVILKQFFTWLNNEKITLNKPFEEIDIGTEKYGTPYYITTKERDMIAETEMPTKRLEAQRDIFIFQCFVGCRVSDLVRFTMANISSDGMLTYTPHKTKEHGSQSLQVRVPLHPKALSLVKKYENVDRHGRLLPVVDKHRYNKYIKKIFTIAGITRMVEIRNTFTGEFEHKPINEVASSHLARRTFIGNLYSKVADPNLIGEMSGHVNGSRAFARYRKIEDEMLKRVIDLL